MRDALFNAEYSETEPWPAQMQDTAAWGCLHLLNDIVNILMNR
jgi:hypothetical protein